MLEQLDISLMGHPSSLWRQCTEMSSVFKWLRHFRDGKTNMKGQNHETVTAPPQSSDSE